MNTPIIALCLENCINRAEDPDNLVAKSSTDMYKILTEFIKDGNFPHNMSIKIFCLYLIKYEGITKTKTRTNNMFEFDTLKLKQYLTKTYKIEFYDKDKPD